MERIAPGKPTIKGGTSSRTTGRGAPRGPPPSVTANQKLESSIEAGDTSVKTLGQRFGKALLQARTAKGINQKQFAQSLNEKPSIVQQYEQGKAVPNPQLIVKMERALGCKLPRK